MLNAKIRGIPSTALAVKHRCFLSTINMKPDFFILTAACFLLGSVLAEERSYRVILPSFSHSASAQVVDTIPYNLDEFTLCYWIRPTNWTRASNRAVLSYSTSDSPNDILITIHNNAVVLSRRGKAVTIHLGNATLSSGQWHHICTTWSVFQGTVHIYADGDFTGSGKLSPMIPFVPLGGEFVLGKSKQSNNASENVCHGCEPWRGDITEINIWDEFLHENDILGISSCNSTMDGNVLSWSKITIIPENGAGVKSVHLCELSHCPGRNFD